MKRSKRDASPAISFEHILSHDDSHSDTHGDYHQDQHSDQHQDHDDSPGHDDFGESMLDRLEWLVSRWEIVFSGMKQELLETVEEHAATQAARIEALEQRIGSLERR